MALGAEAAEGLAVTQLSFCFCYCKEILAPPATADFRALLSWLSRSAGGFHTGTPGRRPVPARRRALFARCRLCGAAGGTARCLSGMLLCIHGRGSQDCFCPQRPLQVRTVDDGESQQMEQRARQESAHCYLSPGCVKKALQPRP